MPAAGSTSASALLERLSGPLRTGNGHEFLWARVSSDAKPPLSKIHLLHVAFTNFEWHSVAGAPNMAPAAARGSRARGLGGQLRLAAGAHNGGRATAVAAGARGRAAIAAREAPVLLADEEMAAREKGRRAPERLPSPPASSCSPHGRRLQVGAGGDLIQRLRRFASLPTGAIWANFASCRAAVFPRLRGYQSPSLRGRSS